MRTIRSLLLVLAICGTLPNVEAQDLSTPVGYMEAFAKAHNEMSRSYLAYMSAAGHGRKAKKVEKLRQKLLETIVDTRNNTRGLGAFRGDNSLRESSVDYITLVYHVFNDDYARIVDMEEVAERSYDEMQAYLLLQEMTEQKLKGAADKMRLAEKAFAEKHNIKLTDEKSEFGKKLETTSKLGHYKNQLFLIFFKCNWQDGLITEAMNNKKVNDLEQGRSALIRYASEGLSALDSLKHFNGDASLAAACRQVLNYYRKAAENELPKLTDLVLKQENFEKIRKAFEAKPESQRTAEDVKAFNKAVNEVNAAVNNFNKINEQLHRGRQQVLQNWERTEREFTDRNMPHYKA